MKLPIISAIALSLVVPAAAYADQPAAIVAPKVGAIVTTADGKRLGRVDEVHSATKRQAASIGVIYEERFVSVPVATLSATEKGYSTSLSLKEVLGKK